MNNRSLLLIYPYLLALACGTSSCGPSPSTPTQGAQKIVIDESYSQLFKAEVESFEGFYKQSNIDDQYKPESDVVNDFMKDSCRLIVLSRDLNTDEKEYFKSRNSFPISTKIAVDALAFITHRDNPVSSLMYNELINIFSGKINSWKYLDSSIKENSEQDTNLTIVFDNEK